MYKFIRWETKREMMTLRDAIGRLFDDAFPYSLSLTQCWHGPALGIIRD